jgi:hypothetical protein
MRGLLDKEQARMALQVLLGASAAVDLAWAAEKAGDDAKVTDYLDLVDKQVGEVTKLLAEQEARNDRIRNSGNYLSRDGSGPRAVCFA